MYLVLPREPYADGPLTCERCGASPAIMDGGVELCLRCSDELRRDAAEQALADAPPMVRQLAAGVRARGKSTWVYLPREQTFGAPWVPAEEGEA